MPYFFLILFLSILVHPGMTAPVNLLEDLDLKYQRQIDSLTALKDGYELKAQNLQTKGQELESQQQTLQSQIAQLQSTIDSLGTFIQATQVSNDSLNSQLTLSKTQLKALESQTEKLTAITQELQSTQASLRDSIQLTQSNIASLQASQSPEVKQAKQPVSQQVKQEPAIKPTTPQESKPPETMTYEWIIAAASAGLLAFLVISHGQSSQR